MTFDGLVDVLVEQFDTDIPTASRIANARIRRLVTRAKWRLSHSTLATTVVGQNDYALPATVADVDMVWVAGDAYHRASREEITALHNDDAELSGASGAYALDEYDATPGVKYLVLWPTPDTAGEPIVVFGARFATSATYGAATALPIPEDVESYLLSGCRADCYRQIEDRADLAPPEEAEFEQGVSELRRLRIELGGQAGRVRVEGYDF